LCIPVVDETEHGRATDDRRVIRGYFRGLPGPAGEEVLCAVNGNGSVALDVAEALDAVRPARAKMEPTVGPFVLVPPKRIYDIGDGCGIEIDDLAEQLLGGVQDGRQLVVVVASPHRRQANATQQVVSLPGFDVEQVERLVVVTIDWIGGFRQA